MATIKVIGITENGLESLPSLYVEWINQSERLVGGKRQLELFPHYEGEKLIIQGGLKAIVDKLQTEPKKTVVLASGDPLFFGIGAYLRSKLDVEIYPNVSSIQEAFAKMKESWHDALFLSVHGRSMKGLAQKIDGQKKICLLTDEENSPQKIARYLLDYNMTEYDVFVAEALGSKEERTSWFTLQQLRTYEAHPLNVVILKKVRKAKSWPLGIPDEKFFQRKPDKGLITKKEVRVLSISELNLKKDSIVWDIGTCTGSVAIEAAKIANFGEVYAIEKNEQDLENCIKNAQKFRVDLTAVLGKAPDRLEQFPDPDAIFIGGTSGNMKRLLEVCCRRLKRGGRIVLNAVTIENLAEATEIFQQLNYETHITLAQISRSKPILHLTRFEGLNPVYIISARRKEETD